MNHASPLTSATTHEDASLTVSLRTIDFPATRDDLLRVAVLDHLPVTDIDAIRALPERSYEGRLDVMRAMNASGLAAVSRDSVLTAPRSVSLH